MRFLVFRFSAMGDVALLVPVVAALARAHSRIAITLVTRRQFAPFFYNIPGVEVIGADVDREYRGITGLYRLFRELKALGPYDYGIDIHGSMRSRILKYFFRIFTGLPFASLVKGRREKRAQIRRRGKVLVQLPHMVERYMHVFERAGISADPGQGPWINPDTHCRALAGDFLKKCGRLTKSGIWIGVAPFAGHEPKMWPMIRMRELIGMLESLGAVVFLFGGKGEEKEILDDIHRQYKSFTHVVAGNLTLEGEMALILRLDAMIAMDSFNMHIASLLGTRTLSIWGSTHPFSGFGPYGPNSRIVQIDPAELTCRPCSIFGNKGCFRGDLACMNRITPEMVFSDLKLLLEKK